MIMFCMIHIYIYIYTYVYYTVDERRARLQVLRVGSA